MPMKADLDWINTHRNEHRTMNSGEEAYIVDGIKSNLTIKFEPNTYVYNKRYSDFLKGRIGNPDAWIKKHRWETSTASNGQVMTLIGGTSTNVTVQFEDGTVVSDKRYEAFLAGHISNPKVTWYSMHKDKEAVASNGMIMRITGGTSCNDVTITFEDGTEVQHQRYENFLVGWIHYPSYSKTDKFMQDNIGKTNMNINGQMMIIIGGTGPRDLTIKFDDDKVVYRKDYRNFLKGTIKNPNLKVHYSGCITGLIGCMKPLRISFKNPSDKSVYYECSCEKCGYSGILSPQEMLKHVCSN